MHVSLKTDARLVEDRVYSQCSALGAGAPGYELHPDSSSSHSSSDTSACSYDSRVAPVLVTAVYMYSR